MIRSTKAMSVSLANKNTKRKKTQKRALPHLLQIFNRKRKALSKMKKVKKK
jgi:hypothetical protein